MQLTIGVLLPRSEMFPTFGLDFLNGLKLAHQNSDKNNISLKYIVEGIGTASDASFLKSAEKLLLQENVDITIAFCGANQLTELSKIHTNYKKSLIHVDLGGTILKTDDTSPYVLHHTLNLWQSAYKTGKFAAAKYGKKVAVIASVYDGGYHMSSAFSEGYTAAGGTVASYYVSPMDYKTETFEKMVSDIAKAQPDFIYAIFSYKEGQKIFETISKSTLNGTIPIVAIPLMTDESFNTRDMNVENVQSIASWSFDDPSTEMVTFKSLYKNEYDEQPNSIGLLGFEVGVTLSKCITSEGKITAAMGTIREKLSWESPRGTLSYSSRNESQVASFKVRKFQFKDGKYHNEITETIEATIDEVVYQQLEELQNVSWHNPYICT